MYPEDSIQNALGSEWWIKSQTKYIRRGSLIFAFAPHIDQIPYMFEPIGRKDPEKHDSAEVIAKPLKANTPLKQIQLPVAAMPLHSGEVWAAYRAKKRPCLVIGNASPEVEKILIQGKPKNQTAPTILVAPYYGANQNEKRTGYKETFVEAVRHCEYPQFFWDKLPTGGSDVSILRLDHLQPIGAHYDSYMMTEYALSDDALAIIDNMLQWLIYGGVEEDCLLMLYRSEIEQFMADVTHE